MDSARDKITKQIIDAESLWDIDPIDKNGYVCHGCGVQVIPCSHERGVNKRRPYFRLKNKDSDHIQPCDVDGEGKVKTKAKKERVGTPDGFPVPYANRLVLVEERERVGDALGLDGVMTAPRPRNENTQPANRRHHGHTVTTIRPLCATYLNYPHDRKHLPLAVPNCPGNTYDTVFYRLWSSKRGTPTFNPAQHLYYAPLRWNKPVFTDEYAECILDAGLWDGDGKKLTNPCRLRVDWSTWSTRKRNTLKNEIEESLDEVKGITGNKDKAWMFFVAIQDADNNYHFTASLYPLICCMVGEMIEILDK